MRLLLLVLLLLLLAWTAEWLLHGGGRASFPLADPLKHRGLVRVGVFVRRSVGRFGLPAGLAWEGAQISRFLAPTIGLVGVKVGEDDGGRARVAGFADAGFLAPAACSRGPSPFN